MRCIQSTANRQCRYLIIRCIRSITDAAATAAT